MTAADTSVEQSPLPSGAEILSHLKARRSDFVAFLEELTRVETPSLVPETQNRARTVIAERLEASGFRTLELTGQNNGGNLYARPRDRSRTDPMQMLIG
ncbi:MAG: hypothetical protein WBN88_21105, partial [Anderseniella sp.]